MWFKKIARAKRFKAIRAEKIARILAVKKELDEWSDIPLSQMINGMCRTLKIRCDKAAYNFVAYEINLSRKSPEELSRMLP